MFPVVGAFFFFAWIFCGIIAPSFVPFSEWKIPAVLKWVIAIVVMATGPIVPMLLFLITNGRKVVNYRKEEERRREQKRINDIMLENSRGMFMTDNSSADAEASAINMVKKLILEGVERRASDIFIEKRKKQGII